MIFRNKDGRYMGTLRGKLFFKTAYRSRHMLREPEAWAIDSDVVRTLELTGTCKNIRVTDKENGIVYQISLEKFLEKAITIDRGHGEQKALPLVYWKFKRATLGTRLKMYTPEAYKQTLIKGDC